MYRITTLWVLLIVGVLGGCSSTSFLYNNAPWLLLDKIDDYFSITNLQEEQLDRDIDLFFKWHREQELPEYAKLISTFNQRLADGLNPAELRELFDQIAAARVRFVKASLQTASLFLASIDNKQLEHFDREVQQKIAEDREHTELSVPRQKEENFDKLLDSLEDWFGEFDQEQQQTLRVLSDARPRQYADWLGRREQRQSKLMQFLRSEPDTPTIEAYLNNHYVQEINQTLDQGQNENRQFWFSTILSIDKIVSAKQRKHAIDRLDGFRRDFLALNRENPDELPVEIDR